ncbi:ATP-binding protein [Virgibacillus sp. W0181]|uniref:ATP-binding protein n=1 Tax=Virgibacillus sp. W0181 TaxID=3391581 RepID=UPI003F4888EA
MVFKQMKVLLILVLIPLLFMGDVIDAKDNKGKNESAILKANTDKVLLDDSIEILIDKYGGYAIEDIVSGRLEEQFTSYKEIGRPNFGYTQDTYWVRFHIDNQSSIQDWLLEIETPKINRIHFYESNTDGSFEKLSMGNKDPFTDKEIYHRNFIMNLPIKSYEEQTFYMQLRTGGSMQIPLTVWNPAAFGAKSQTGYMLFGILIGISVVMSFYNLFLYFSIRDRSYLYYVLFVVLNGFLYLSDTGLAFQFLWPELVRWNLQAVVTFMCLANMAALLFTRSFLRTNQFVPRLDRLFKVFLIVNALTAIWSLFSFTLAMYAAIICVAVTITLVISTLVISLRRKYRPARFFALAWGTFLFGVSVSILVDAGLLPLIPFTKYAWHVTTTLEVVLLSLALGDRYKVMRMEKEQAKKEAIASQKLALKNLKKTDKLKDEFLAVTSHELRTPLNGIIGIAETLRGGAAGKITKELDRHLWMISVSGRRLANLVDDIIDFSRLKNDDLAIHPEPVHLFTLTDVVLTICQPLTKDKPILLKNQIDPSTPLVIADENRLQQILYNLVGNAIKYTDGGEVNVSAKKQENFLKIIVSDTGKGIPSDQMDTIFEPFHQGDSSTSREVGGSGIGLSITKRLVELHQGEINVVSTVGHGSTFSFTLPISEDQSRARLEAASTIISRSVAEEEFGVVSEPEIISHTEKTTILIADDEFVNLQVLKNQLSMEGYDVIAVSNGEGVMEEVRKRPVHLLILDIMMPKMSGYEVCRRLREHYSLMELPILMLTAKTQMHDQITAFEVGANDYLTKPCDKQELLTRVKTLLKLSRLNLELKELNQHLEEKVDTRTEALKKANQNLEKANQELINMAESRRMLLANIAHELGTPVTVIQGYMQAVQDGLIIDHDPRYLDMVEHKLQILNRLIADLSDLSKWEAGTMSLNKEKVNLNEWLNQVHAMHEWDVKQEDRLFSFVKKQNAEKFTAYACHIDVGRMDQLFSNLIWNAIKHTEPNTGELIVTVMLMEKTSEVVIQLQDNGHGIDEEKLPFIFERFYKATNLSTQDDSGGTGLGLAIVKEIIEAHEGTVRVESRPGVGSKFTVVLPIYHVE